MARPRTRPLGRFGKRLQQRIESRGKTHASICQLAGISPVTLWRWMTADRAPSLERASRLAKALGCTVGDLFPRKQSEATKNGVVRAKRVAVL